MATVGFKGLIHLARQESTLWTSYHTASIENVKVKVTGYENVKSDSHSISVCQE